MCVRIGEETGKGQEKMSIFMCTLCVPEKKKGMGARLPIVLHCGRTECFEER